MNQTNLYFYFTPTKFESKEVTSIAPCSSIPSSSTTLADQKLNKKIENLEEECDACENENQMTQRILQFKKSNSSIPLDNTYSKLLFMEQENCNKTTQQGSEIDLEQSPFNNKLKQQEEEEDFQNAKTQKLIKGISKNKQLKKASSQCSIQISRFDSVRSLHFDEKKPSATLSESATKLIAQIKNNKDETKRALSPARNAKLNAILNRGSLKDRYRNLIGSKVIDINKSENKELLNLISRVEDIMMRRNRAFLSELIAAISGLTILKMNAIMNICPNLYLLSLRLNKFQQQDMLIELPNCENVINVQAWRESRLTNFKQRLYYSEKQQQNNNEQPSCISQKLTEAIKESLKGKQNQLNDEFAKLISQQNQNQSSTQEEMNIPLSAIAQIVKEYFESRNVSNIFKINIVENISKNTNSNLVVAETKLNDLINSYPSWLTEVKSSTLGSIVRINYTFNFETISHN